MHKLVLTLRLCKTAYRVTIHFKPPQLNICPVSFALRSETESLLFFADNTWKRETTVFAVKIEAPISSSALWGSVESYWWVIVVDWVGVMLLTYASALYESRKSLMVVWNKLDCMLFSSFFLYYLVSKNVCCGSIFLSWIAGPELSEETVPKLLGIANLLKVSLCHFDGSCFFP